MQNYKYQKTPTSNNIFPQNNNNINSFKNYQNQQNQEEKKKQINKEYCQRVSYRNTQFETPTIISHAQRKHFNEQYVEEAKKQKLRSISDNLQTKQSKLVLPFNRNSVTKDEIKYKKQKMSVNTQQEVKYGNLQNMVKSKSQPKGFHHKEFLNKKKNLEMSEIQAGSQRVLLKPSSYSKSPQFMQEKRKIHQNNYESDISTDAFLSQRGKKTIQSIENDEKLYENAIGKPVPQIIDFSKKMRKQVDYYQPVMKNIIFPNKISNDSKQKLSQNYNQNQQKLNKRSISEIPTSQSQKDFQKKQFSKEQSQIHQIITQQTSEKFDSKINYNRINKSLSPYNTSFKSENISKVLNQSQNNNNKNNQQQQQQQQLNAKQANEDIFLLKNTKKKIIPDHKLQYYKSNQEQLSYNLFQLKNASRENLIESQTKLEKLKISALKDFQQYENYNKQKSLKKLESDDNLGQKSLQTQTSYNNNNFTPKNNKNNNNIRSSKQNLQGETSPFTLTPQNNINRFLKNSNSGKSKSPNNFNPKKTFSFYGSTLKSGKNGQYFNKDVTKYSKQLSNIKQSMKK